MKKINTLLYFIISFSLLSLFFLFMSNANALWGGIKKPDDKIYGLNDNEGFIITRHPNNKVNTYNINKDYKHYDLVLYNFGGEINARIFYALKNVPAGKNGNQYIPTNPGSDEYWIEATMFFSPFNHYQVGDVILKKIPKNSNEANDYYRCKREYVPTFPIANYNENQLLNDYFEVMTNLSKKPGNNKITRACYKPYKIYHMYDVCVINTKYYMCKRPTLVNEDPSSSSTASDSWEVLDNNKLINRLFFSPIYKYEKFTYSYNYLTKPLLLHLAKVYGASTYSETNFERLDLEDFGKEK